jgi:hypothetical protein
MSLFLPSLNQPSKPSAPTALPSPPVQTVFGRTIPRIFTPPLRDLSQPEASYGHDLVAFAEAIGWKLDPWEEWAAIHMGELLPDGRPRFRFVLILVARQNGKTTLCRVLVLYWMFIEMHDLILATNSSRDTAKQSWRKTIEMAERSPLLAEELPPKYVRGSTGEEAFYNVHGSTYRFAAPNRRAGRSFTLRRLLLDELREHQDFDAYNAAVNAGNAVRDFQAVAITNQGGLDAVVLDDRRNAALEYINNGVGDGRIFLAEWSAPLGSDPTDPQALAMANPNLGYRIDIENIMGDAISAKAVGGAKLADFKTEVMCMKVTSLNAAINEEEWALCGTDNPINLADHRDRLVLCADVSLDGSHASLVAAANVGGKTHVEVIAIWKGYGCTQQMRRELPEIVTKIRPRRFGWFPNGPAAAVAAALRSKTGSRSWYPRSTVVKEMTSEVPAVCMGLGEQIMAGEVSHPRDEALTAHVLDTEKLLKPDGTWSFTRRGQKPIDGAYALAGAVQMARMLPAPRPDLVVAY